jgi:hypothetical protein
LGTGSFHPELVSTHCLRLSDRTRGKLYDRVSAQARREAPRTYVAPDLHDPTLAIEIDQVNGESHPEGVYRFARHYPKTLAIGQGFSSEQAFPSGAVIAGEPHVLAELDISGQIENAHIHLRRCRTARSEAGYQRNKTGARRVHDLPVSLIREVVHSR